MTRHQLSEQIDLFLQTLAAEKGYSDHTIRAYGHDLTEFGGYVAREKGSSVAEKPPSVVITSRVESGLLW